MSASSSSRPPAPVASTRQQLDELDAMLQRMLELPVNQLDTDTPRPRPARPVTPAPAEPRVVEETAAEHSETPAETAPEPALPPLPPRTPTDRASPYMVIATVGPHVQPQTAELQNPIDPASLGPRLLKPPTEEEDKSPAAGAATETPAKSASGDSEEGWVPLRSSWQPSAHSWQPLAETWQQRKLPAPEPAAGQPAQPVPAAQEESEQVPDEHARDPVTPGPLAPLPLNAPAPEHMAALPLQPLSVHDLEPPPSWWLQALRSFNQGFETCLGPCGAVGRFLTSSRGRLLLGSLGAVCLTAAATLLVLDRIGWTR